MAEMCRGTTASEDEMSIRLKFRAKSSLNLYNRQEIVHIFGKSIVRPASLNSVKHPIYAATPVKPREGSRA
jgi:hypothetical protein